MGVPLWIRVTDLAMGDDSDMSDRDRRKETMQKCSFPFGFEDTDYKTSANLMGGFDHGEKARGQVGTGMAENMRKSSIWWKDSDYLKERAPPERYETSHAHHFVEKEPEPNSMGMTIPMIKEFHRKTNYEFGHTKNDYGTTEASAFHDFSKHKNLTCEVDIPHLVLATPQCPTVAQNDYSTTNAANFSGAQGEQNGVNRDNIKEMRRTHFEVGYDEIDWDDTTHKGSFHRHPFLQMKDNAEKVRELRQTNWTFGFEDDGKARGWKGTYDRTFDEGHGSAAYPGGIKRKF